MIKVSVHSIVDVITNSSTSIYTGAHGKTIECAKELINTILKSTGIENKNADDFFDFKLVPEEEVLFDAIFDNIDDYENIINDNLGTNAEKMTEKEKVEYLTDKIMTGKIPNTFKHGEANDEDYDTRELLIISKNKNIKTMNLTNIITNMFEIDGSYNG